MDLGAHETRWSPRSWVVRRPRSHDLDDCPIGLVVRRTSSRRGPSTFVVGRLTSRRDPRADTAGEASAPSSASFPCGARARAVGFGLHRQVVSGAIGRKSRWTMLGAGSPFCEESSGLPTGSTMARRCGAPGRSPVRDDGQGVDPAGEPNRSPTTSDRHSSDPSSHPIDSRDEQNPQHAQDNCDGPDDHGCCDSLVRPRPRGRSHTGAEPPPPAIE